MEVPLIIDGSPAGTLCMVQSGLYTLMEANVDGCAKKLIRLWAHGGGKSAYLGVMQPWSGGLWLRRKLSRRELAAFPSPIAYASDRETDADGQEAKVEEPDEKESFHNEDAQREEAPEMQEAPEENSLHNTGTNTETCPWPAEIPEGDLLWYAREDGSLVSHDGISALLALPEELRERSALAAVRTIEGKNYLVFRY